MPAIQGASNTSPIVITSMGNIPPLGSRVTISGVTGNTAANGTWWVITSAGNPNQFTLLNANGSGNYAGGGTWTLTPPVITAATNANPIAFTTSAPHGLSTGMNITVTGVLGNTNANAVNNGGWVTVTGANTFTIDGSRGNGNYTGGGTFILLPPEIQFMTGNGVSPIVIVSAFHGLATGNTITVGGVTGNTAANGPWVVTVISPNQFSLNNSTGNGVWTNTSGTWALRNPQTVLQTSGSGTPDIVYTVDQHGLSTGNNVTITGVVGDTAANVTAHPITVIDNYTFSLNSITGNGTYVSGGIISTVGSITGATNSTPILITSAAHGLTSGAVVTISGVGGNTAANGMYPIYVNSPNTFSLMGTTGNGVYTSGGTWILATGANTVVSAVGTPIIIGTQLAHGLTTGDHVLIANVQGNTAANGAWYIQYYDTFHFILVGSVSNGTYVPSTGTYALDTTTSQITETTGNAVYPIEVTAPAHGLTTGQHISITGVSGNTAANNSWFVSVVDANNFNLYSDALLSDPGTGNGAYGGGGSFVIVAPVITNATNASPIVCTSANNGLASGQRLIINSVGGNTNANTSTGYFIQVLTVNTFALYNDYAFSSPVVGNGAFTSNGVYVVIPQTVVYATNNSPIAITALNHGLTSGLQVAISSVQGNTAANGNYYINVIDQNTFSLYTWTTTGQLQSVGNGSYVSGTGTYSIIPPTITSVTGNAVSPIVVTSANHGLVAYQQVTITGVGGNTNANGTYYVIPLNANTFQLVTITTPNSIGTATTGNANYTSGGTFSIVANTISNTTSSGSPITVTTSYPHGLSNGNRVFIQNVLGNTNANGYYFVQNCTGYTFDLSTSLSSDTGTTANGTYANIAGNLGFFTLVPPLITGATNASPIVITSNNHGLINNQVVVIANITGNTAANGVFTITACDTNTFTLVGSTGNGLYTAKGNFTVVLPIITAATNASPIVCTCVDHGLTSGNIVVITGGLGNTAINGTWTVTVLTSSTFSLNSSTGNGTYTSSATFVLAPQITGATNASPIVVTTSIPHGLGTGSKITIVNVAGNTATNGTWYITVLSPTTFSLNGSTGNGSWTTSSGTYTVVQTSIVNAEAAADGSNNIVITTSAPHGLTSSEGIRIMIYNIVGTTEANGPWIAPTIINASQLQLVGSTYVNAYVSGGTFVVRPNTLVTITGAADDPNDPGSILIQAPGHGFNADEVAGINVVIQNIRENTVCNGSWQIIVKDINSFWIQAVSNGIYTNTATWINTNSSSSPEAIAFVTNKNQSYTTITTVVPHGLSTGNQVVIAGVNQVVNNGAINTANGNTLPNPATWTITVTSTTAFTIPVNNYGSPPYTGGGQYTAAPSGADLHPITDCTAADTGEILVTSTAHGLSDGALIWVQDVLGTDEANTLDAMTAAYAWTVNASGDGCDANNFILSDIEFLNEFISDPGSCIGAPLLTIAYISTIFQVTSMTIGTGDIEL